MSVIRIEVAVNAKIFQYNRDGGVVYKEQLKSQNAPKWNAIF